MIDALELALGTGATSISINGRTVNYASVSDMLQALDYLKSKLDIPIVEKPIFRRVNLGSRNDFDRGCI